MKKVKLLFMQFKLNVVMNVFFIIQCVLVFLMTNSTVSSLFYDNYVGKYVGFDGKTTIFLSGAVENNVSINDPEAFYDLATDIESIAGVTGVGYQMNEYFLSGKNNDVIVDAFVLNDAMLMIKYPLSQGSWFDNDNTETQVILGGDISRIYRVGDIITLYKLEVIDGVLEYVPVNAKLMGKMKEPTFAVNLHFSSNQPEYVNMFEPYKNLIITNDMNLICAEDIRYPLMSLLVFTDGTADIQTIKNELSRFGQPFDFTEVDKFYKAGIQYKISNKLPTTGIMLLGILFGVIGITYLSIYQNMRSLSVYYLFGMNSNECMFFTVALNTAMLISSMFFSFILYFVPTINNYLFRRSMIGIYNLLFCVLFVACIVGLSTAVSYSILRKSPIETLRRFE